MNINEKPLVSILTPTYNQEQYIGACIESVINQTYQNWEMLIIDDDSTDNTWNVVQAYAKKEPRIHPIKQSHKGMWRLSEGYNHALEKSSGEIIAFLDGDDIWVTKKLEIQVPMHLSENYLLSFGQIKLIDNNGDFITNKRLPNGKNNKCLRKPDGNDLKLKFIMGEFMIPAVTVLITKLNLLSIGGVTQPKYLPLVDYPTIATLACEDGKFHYIPQVLGYWRQSLSQTTWTLSREMAYGNFRFSKELIQNKAIDNPGKDSTAINVLSKNRRNYLADASYRAAVVSADKNNYTESITYCKEILHLRVIRMVLKCVVMLAWKKGKGFLRTFKKK